MFSRRSAFPAEPNALAEAVASARATGRPIADLTASNPTTVGLPYEGERILRALSRAEALRFEPRAFGLDSARALVSREVARDGIDVSPERVVLTASTSEAYSFAFQLLCDAGDAVLVPAPSYPLLEQLAALSSVRLVPYPLVYDGAWHVDTDALRRAVVPDARAVVVVSPNNPTGSFTKREELRALASLGLPIVSDEVFARYPLIHDDTRAPSALDAEGVLVLALGGLSKAAALPQLKLGWMLLGGPEAPVRAALERLEIIADSFLSVGAPVQHAVGELFEATRHTVDAIVARARANLDQLARAASGEPVSVLRVEGGWYAVLRLPSFLSEDEWVLSLLRERGVLVQPGWFFDFSSGPVVVVSLLTPERTLRQGFGEILALVRDRAR
jgi:aspartate/methionine/tyrosine aminotransferase